MAKKIDITLMSKEESCEDGSSDDRFPKAIILLNFFGSVTQDLGFTRLAMAAIVFFWRKRKCGILQGKCLDLPRQLTSHW